MSSGNTASSPIGKERRVRARRRMEGLAYVDLGPDNGAILIDLGEGGLGFHSVAPVTLDQAVLLKFKLPGASGFIESYAEVVWLNESGKGGGVRFVELKPESREQIGAWAAGTATAAEVGPAEVGKADSSATQVNNKAQHGIEAAPANQTGAENASAKGETAVEAEPAGTPVDLAPEPVFEEVPAGISEGFADGDSGVIKTDEDGIVAASAAPPHARTKAHPLPPDGVSGRVHSGIMAASAEESSVPEPPVAPSAGSATASEGAHAKQPVPSRAANSVSSESWEKSTGGQPRSPLAAMSVEDAHRSASVERQSQAMAQVLPRRRKEWEPQGEELIPQIETPASQALKLGIGAAAGAILVLGIVAVVPSLRTRVLATGNAKSAAAPLEAGMSEFQVEVADVNNRRWILRSGGEAGSPFVDTSSRRNAQPPAAPARKNTVKSERSGESDDASEAPAPETPQPRTAKPGELALARPLKSAPVVSQVQNLPPSIFDGITPPIGSLADNLPSTGPNAPGPAPVQPGLPGGDLQAAVLLTRVAPVYPSDALHDGLRGEVRVKATIGRDGVPRNLTAVSGDPRLIEAALQAIRQWRYRPAMIEGRPIESTTTVSVAFQLN